MKGVRIINDIRLPAVSVAALAAESGFPDPKAAKWKKGLRLLVEQEQRAKNPAASVKRFANASERAQAKPAFIGQPGVQESPTPKTFYVARSLGAGDWVDVT